MNPIRVSLDEQIRCVKREIHMRETVYPRWIDKGRMTQARADAEINAMRAVQATLERVLASERPQLFAEEARNDR